MKQNIVNFIVKKYIKYDNKNPFIGISSILAFVGVMIGVMVLMVTMAIMNGTSKEFKDKLFVMNYPMTIYPQFSNEVNNDLLIKLEDNFQDLKFSPYIRTQVMIQNAQEMSGGVLFGVNSHKESQLNSIYKNSVSKIQKLNKYDVVLGSGIVSDLFLEDNSKVVLYFTKTNPTGFSVMPILKRFNYVSDFTSGLISYDKAYMYTSIEALRSIMGTKKDVFDGIHIYSKVPMEDIHKLRLFLKDENVNIIGWWEQNGNLFSAMELEKKALFVILMLIVIVASLSIISSLLMTVMSRRKEIALFLAMGASVNEVKSIFFRLGMIIGLSGIVAGVLFGFLNIYLLTNFDIISLPTDVYGTSKLPIELLTSDFVFICLGSIFIITLFSYYPAKKATKINIIDVLRNE